MSFETVIQDIQSGLSVGRYANEAAVSQGIILRVLHALAWDIYDTSKVVPEFPLGSGRVDYALCCSPKWADIIVESKNIGRAAGSERQLFEYAFHQGIPMAVLTDGQEWSFFLPAEQGSYHERCVYKLDLFERPVGESAKILARYLAFNEVASGRSIENAKNDYRTVDRSRRIQSALPEAWRQLLNEQDEFLVDLVADRVEAICGFKPEPGCVADFIGRIAANEFRQVTSSRTTREVVEVGSKAAVLADDSKTQDTKPGDSEFNGFSLKGQRYTEGNAIKTLFRVLEVLSVNDSSFLDRYAALPRHGRKRRYVSRNKYELYPGRPDLCEEYSVSKFGGWWIGTNYNRSTIRNAIEIACEVASIKFGTELKLI
jgi:predicted type IV restriction endonuclease